MPDRIDVFISSTSRDLKKYRDKLKDAVLNAGAFPIAMEEFDATERSALQKCYDELASAEVFIGVYAHRYGFAPGPDMRFTDAAGREIAGDGVTSITEWEYRWALERRLPMLLYIVADEDDDGEPLPWPPTYLDGEPARARLTAFKSAIAGTHVVGFFRSPDDLARQVAGALPKLIARYTDPAPARAAGRRDFYRHVNLPVNYLPRPDLITHVRDALLAREDGIALHGMGGIGKSVIARALCDDDALQAAFPDGILWVSIGQDAREDDLKGRLRTWIETLGGTIGDAAPPLERLKDMLGGLLARARCLLILDDVWRRRDADHFRVGGPGCRLLVTTRDAEVARALGVPVQPIPLLTDAEADALLDQWADGGLKTVSAESRRRIYDATLGRLPLAIRLAGAQLRGRSPDEWLRAFDARRLALRRPESTHDSLALTFGVSLDALNPDDRALYAALAIFKEDEPIPASVIARLWSASGGLDAVAARDLIDDLAARALLEIVGGDGGRSVIVHDLLRDFMRAELGDPAPAHAALLRGYDARGGWHTINDDGYLYDHLAYHLDGAGDHDALRRLFLSAEWMRARVSADGYRYDGYLADLDIARTAIFEPRAEAQITAFTNGFGAFADVVRTSLIRTTINSLAANHNRELIVRAIEIGLPGWTPARALSIARHILRPTTRVTLYAMLLKTGKLSPDERAFALTAGLTDARVAVETPLQVEVIARMIPVVDEPMRAELIRDALHVLSQIRTTEALVFATSEIARHLTRAERAPLTQRALAAALTLSQENPRGEALRMLAPHLTPDQHPTALEAIAAIDNERFAIDTFEVLLPYLGPESTDRALAVCETFAFPGFRARARAAIVAFLPHDHRQRAALLDGAIADCAAPMEWWVGVGAVAAVSNLLDGADRQGFIDRALEMSAAIESPRSRARALTALAAALRPGDTEALAVCLDRAAQSDADEESISDLLVALAGKLDPAGQRVVLSIVPRLEDIKWRSRVLAAHAPFFDAPLLTEALDFNVRIGDQRAQIEAVIALSGVLPPAERDAACVRALALVDEIADPKARAKALAPLAAAVGEPHIDRIFELIAGLRDDHSRMKVISGAGVNATAPTSIARLLGLARALKDADARAEALLALWDHLSPSERETLVSGIAKGDQQRPIRIRARLVQARDTEDDDRRAELLGMVLESARQITSPHNRAGAIGEIGRTLDSPEVRAAAAEALEGVMKMTYPFSQASALAWLSRLLSPADRARAIALASSYNDHWARLWATAALIAADDRADSALVIAARQGLFDYMRGRVNQRRESVLQVLVPRAIFSPPIISRDAVADLARIVIAVCWEWEWL